MARVMRKIFLGLVFCLVFLYPKTSHAFSVSPLKYRVTIDPGAEQRLTISVHNSDAGRRLFSFFAQSATVDENGNAIFSNVPVGASTWFVPDVDGPIVLATGETRAVQFRLSVPTSTVPGSYVAGLVVEEKSKDSENVGVRPRAAVMVVVDVAGTVTEAVEIRSFKTEKIFNSQTAWPMTLEMRNTGSMAVGMEAIMRVTTFFGREVGSSTVETGGLFLNQSNRQLRAHTDVKKFLWPGIYRVVTDVAYGQNESKISARATVVYVPEWVFAVAAGCVFGVYVWRIIRRKRKL